MTVRCDRRADPPSRCAGVVATALYTRKRTQHGRPEGVVRDDQPDAREGQAGRCHRISFAARIASCASADLALGDLATNIVFRSVGVERNFGPFEHHQQFGLVGIKPCQQAVEGDEPGLAREDAVEACPQGGFALPGGMLAIGFKIAIEPPDQSADMVLGDALLIREGIELVDETLGMHPA